VEKPDLYWVQDGSGENSCHINDGRLNFKESLLGVLVYDRNAGWQVVLKDGTNITPEEGCPTLARARMHLEAYSRRRLAIKARV
jgi:hypothetical protein